MRIVTTIVPVKMRRTAALLVGNLQAGDVPVARRFVLLTAIAGNAAAAGYIRLEKEWDRVHKVAARGRVAEKVAGQSAARGVESVAALSAEDLEISQSGGCKGGNESKSLELHGGGSERVRQ